MKKIIIIYVYTVFSFLYASSLEFYENSYAVLIGINNYVSEDIPDLGYAVEDAESISNLLISKLKNFLKTPFSGPRKTSFLFP